MTDEINFLDIIALKKITDTAVVEKFGGLINSSFFDASNILGTLKLKGLIDFTTAVPGQNAITVTDTGKKLLTEAADKAKMQFDPLDLSVLTQLSGGKRTLNDLHGSTNISPRDLAMHLNKMAEQQFVNADIRNGTVNITLSEKGFMQVKEGMPKPPAPQTPPMQVPQPAPKPMAMPGAAAPQPILHAPPPPPAPAATSQPLQPQPQAPAPGQNGNDIAELEKELKIVKGKRTKKLAYIVVTVVIIVILAVLFQRGLI